MKKKRSVKEKKVAEVLTAYSHQLGDLESVYTVSVIHSKIDNLKTQAKENYKKYRKMTATGSPVGDPSEDSAFTSPLLLPHGTTSGCGITNLAMCLSLVLSQAF